MKKLFVVMLGLFALTSCNPMIDVGGGNSLVGYYTYLDKLATTSQFNRINQAIADNEVLSSYSSVKYYAKRSFFFENDGRWFSSAARYGACRYMPENSNSVSTYSIDVVQILNSNTLVVYGAWLWDPDEVPSSAKILGSVYGGKYIGDLVYASYYEYTYTYTQIDNKLFVSNGDIYTVSNGGLIEDGRSGVMNKYNP